LLSKLRSRKLGSIRFPCHITPRLDRAVIAHVWRSCKDSIGLRDEAITLAVGKSGGTAPLDLDDALADPRWQSYLPI
jgi:hypothetical protein